MKKSFTEIPFADIDEFDFVAFTVTKVKTAFYVDMLLMSEDQKNGMIFATSITASTLIEVGMKIKQFLSSGIFDHLGIATNSTCFNEYGEEEYQFDFADYYDFLDYDTVSEHPTIN